MHRPKGASRYLWRKLRSWRHLRMSQLCYLHQLRETQVRLKFEEWNKRGYITQGALRGVMGSLANQANVQNASMFSASLTRTKGLPVAGASSDDLTTTSLFSRPHACQQARDLMASNKGSLKLSSPVQLTGERRGSASSRAPLSSQTGSTVQ